LIEPHWGMKFFGTSPDWSWGSPSLVYSGYQFIPGCSNGQGLALNTRPYLAPSLKKEYSYNCTPR